jgi:hypothetical protein
MQCLPFSFQESRMDIEIRIANDSNCASNDIIHVRIHEEENLNFDWLEKEVQSLYYLNYGGRRLKYIFGFRGASGIFMRKEADLWSTCAAQSQFLQRPSFTLVQDCPLNHLLTDSHLRVVTHWLGYSISLLGALMVVDQRFKRVFSSDKCWRGLQLCYPYFGMGSSGYDKWLVEEAGLPAYNVLRVLSISLTSSRLRIWLGNTNAIEKDWLDLSFFKRIFGAKVAPEPKLPLVLMVGITSGTRQLHKNLQYLLPDSVIGASRRIGAALLPSDKIASRERLGHSGHHYRVEVPGNMAVQYSRSNSPRDEINDDIDTAAIHVLGDERLQFLSLLHNEQNAQRFRPLLVNAQAIAFCMDICLLPADAETQTWRIEDELRILYDNYCTNTMTHSATADRLADCINACNVPVVVFACIQDLDYFHDHPAMNLNSAVQTCCKLVADIMTNVIQARSKRDALGAKREWWIQPCSAKIKEKSEKKCLQYGFIAGINYLLRAIPNS